MSQLTLRIQLVVALVIVGAIGLVAWSQLNSSPPGDAAIAEAQQWIRAKYNMTGGVDRGMVFAGSGFSEGATQNEGYVRGEFILHARGSIPQRTVPFWAQLRRYNESWWRVEELETPGWDPSDIYR